MENREAQNCKADSEKAEGSRITRPEEKLGNPQKTIQIIQKYGFAFQKKFGQNFLIDMHVLDKIIELLE